MKTHIDENYKVKYSHAKQWWFSPIDDSHALLGSFALPQWANLESKKLWNCSRCLPGQNDPFAMVPFCNAQKFFRSDAPISNNQMQTNNQMHPFQFMQKYLINNHTQILKKKLSKNK